MAGVLFILILGALGYYLTTRKSRARKPTSSARPVTRNEARGEAGETAVRLELRRILDTLCGTHYYLHPTSLIILHAPGTPHPTAEIDHLVITPFGMFVIETKAWSGYITSGHDGDTLTRILQDGTREVRQSPDRQNRSKVAFLRSVMPGMWPIEGLGVFAGECDLDPALPLSLVKLRELEHWLRSRRQAYLKKNFPPVNVNAAWEAVRLVADLDPCALHNHRVRVTHQ
ncbi:nuclease-related domain-containing protein [Paraburkholderia megapolitana]|uniref:nuclease-related domain-containing protein n=1 Tax=Paraburkholderia megapolitana TaxID=420953 RepID=UPI0038B76D98